MEVAAEPLRVAAVDLRAEPRRVVLLRILLRTCEGANQ